MAQTEVKVTGATVGAFVAGVAVALLNALVANSEIMGSFPGWIQFVLLAVVPPVVAFLSGYATPSTTSTVSSAYRTDFDKAA